MPALALLSGGLDSTVAAAHAAREHGLALALTFDYGQRAAAREIEAARSIADALKSNHRVVRIPFLQEIAASALMDTEGELPEASQEDLDDPEAASARARSVWVPNRNGLFINVAACFAQVENLDTLVVGFNREEAKTFPDNRPGFLEACNQALAFTLDQPVKVVSPVAHLDKTGIVLLGLDLDAPLDRIWSCYAPGPGHCFRCESCLRLKRALFAAGAWERFAPLLKGNKS